MTTALLDRHARIDDPIEATIRRGFLGGAAAAALLAGRPPSRTSMRSCGSP